MLFVLANEAGTFALLGTAPAFAMVRRDAAPPAADDGDELSDDLDFSMM